MLSLPAQESDSRSFLYRIVAALVILVVTVAVSVIWKEMVYTIPVLAVLLFLAAGMKGLSGGIKTRQLDKAGGNPIVDIDIELGAR